MEKSTKIVIELEDGRKMNAELLPEYAPLSVNNFLKLIDEKFFDGLCFHRTIPGFMIQGGGFVYNNGLVHKEAKDTVKGEFRSNNVENSLKHVSGVLSMARTMVKNSATSQFFICTGETSFLDGEYAAFGRIVDADSLKVALDISQVKTTNWNGYGDVPIVPVVIKTIARA